MEPRAGSARADEVNPLEITPEFDDLSGLKLNSTILAFQALRAMLMMTWHRLFEWPRLRGGLNWFIIRSNHRSVQFPSGAFLLLAWGFSSSSCKALDSAALTPWRIVSYPNCGVDDCRRGCQKKKVCRKRCKRLATKASFDVICLIATSLVAQDCY